jgi:hypothetical protein
VGAKFEVDYQKLPRELSEPYGPLLRLRTAFTQAASPFPSRPSRAVLLALSTFTPILRHVLIVPSLCLLLHFISLFAGDAFALRRRNHVSSPCNFGGCTIQSVGCCCI